MWVWIMWSDKSVLFVWSYFYEIFFSFYIVLLSVGLSGSIVGEEIVVVC